LETTDTQTTTQPEGAPGEGLQPERTYTKIELQEVINARQAAKEEARKLAEKVQAFEAAEAARKQKELEEKGQYQTIIEETNNKLKSYESELEENRKLVQSIKEDLLAQLPEEHRAIAEVLSLDKLREYVKLNSKPATPGTETARAGGITPVDVSGKDWDDFSHDELKQLKQSNKQIYSSLFQKKYGQRPN